MQDQGLKQSLYTVTKGTNLCAHTRFYRPCGSKQMTHPKPDFCNAERPFVCSQGDRIRLAQPRPGGGSGSLARNGARRAAGPPQHAAQPCAPPAAESSTLPRVKCRRCTTAPPPRPRTGSCGGGAGGRCRGPEGTSRP